MYIRLKYYAKWESGETGYTMLLKHDFIWIKVNPFTSSQNISQQYMEAFPGLEQACLGHHHMAGGNNTANRDADHWVRREPRSLNVKDPFVKVEKMYTHFRRYNKLNSLPLHKSLYFLEVVKIFCQSVYPCVLMFVKLFSSSI